MRKGINLFYTVFSMIDSLPAHRSRRRGTGPGPARSWGGRSCRTVCRRGRCASAAARWCSAWAAGPAGPSCSALNRYLMVQIFLVRSQIFLVFVIADYWILQGLVQCDRSWLHSDTCILCGDQDWQQEIERRESVAADNTRLLMPRCYYEQETFSTFCWLSLRLQVTYSFNTWLNIYRPFSASSIRTTGITKT